MEVSVKAVAFWTVMIALTYAGVAIAMARLMSSIPVR